MIEKLAFTLAKKYIYLSKMNIPLIFLLVYAWHARMLLSAIIWFAIFLKNMSQMFENAVFMGIFAAEILYLIAIITKTGKDSVRR